MSAKPINLNEIDAPENYEKVLELCKDIRATIEWELTRSCYKPEDLEWLMSIPTHDMPAFQSMCLRVKNAVFSFLLVFYGGKNEAGMPILNWSGAYGHVNPEGHQALSLENDLYPVYILVNAHDLSDIMLAINTKDGITQIPFDFLDRLVNSYHGPGVMSDWELNNFGVLKVVESLYNEGIRQIRFCDAPGITPQIYFYDKEGNRCYVCVDAHPNALSAKPLNSAVPKNQQGTGYFADVPVSFLQGNNGDFCDSVVYRGCLPITSFEGILQWDEAVEKYGSQDGYCNVL